MYIAQGKLPAVEFFTISRLPWLASTPTRWCISNLPTWFRRMEVRFCSFHWPLIHFWFSLCSFQDSCWRRCIWQKWVSGCIWQKMNQFSWVHFS